MKPGQQKIIRERRQYNQWVNSQTLEDYALRFTAQRARRSTSRVGNTALGPIAFLACEAIGGTLTLLYGFPNVGWAIGAFAVLMFLIGLPIAYYAARYGVDIDLLTRGAGFGYMGSTVTSLIYASFTFLLFAIEASIMSVALNLVFDIPMWLAHICSSLVVIPIALYGISLISRMQIITQPIWLVLQFVPIAIIAWNHPDELAAWTSYSGSAGAGDGAFNFVMFGLAASVLLSLLPQIGEQVDYLRFLPDKTRKNRVAWWTAVIGTGPGWVLLGAFKLLVGSFLAVWLVRQGVHPSQADEPTTMYHHAFRDVFQSPTFALVLTGIFVIVCQLKINVTNAYAGSIAWSNFFSRLTHSHPGRVVWLVFNVVLALILMEIGIFRAIESILVIYANFAAGWIGALTADLVVNKPLGYSPRYIEFKRAHLYDINPVGVGALAISVVLSSLAFMGAFGHYAEILSPFVALFAAFVAAPVIAIATRGKYYLARPADGIDKPELECSICENLFERGDIAMCPAYSGPICSLCCTLEARCRDICKTDSRFNEQLDKLIRRVLPRRVGDLLNTRAGHFGGLLLLSNLAIGFLLALIYQQYSHVAPEQREAIQTTLWLVYFALLFVSGVMAWLIVLAHESRRAAEAESARQTTMLMDEIDAHKRTDAALQKAKEVAEAANVAKTRYIAGISHEIRSPLNSIYGYAQLMERGTGSSENAVRVIRRSAEHLADLIDGILDISKIENGILRLNRDKVPLVEFLDQIVDMFRLQAAAKGIEFRYQRPPNLPAFVHVDQKRLRQILINLLSNAIKYTERGSASLVVRYRSQVAEFEVADTGVGIPASELERVFEPFERGQGANVRAIPGTGLGLTITKLLTQIMGGEINAQSTEGVGTTFTVRLLLSEAAHTPTVENVREVTGYQGRRRRVLLIDDDASHIDIVSSLLTPLGFELKWALDGATGLALAAGWRPDLAMVDLSMPGMTGWQVAAELRRLPGLETVRVVIASANAHEFAPGGGTAVHDAFLIKPIDMQRLIECLAQQLQLQWTHASAAAAAPAGVEDSTLPAHSQHHVDDLYQLGLIGHVRGIQAKLREMENDPANKPFANHMRTLVANFDLKRYMHVLEGLRKHG
jgi:signal transduction histidine kinase/CheY-like chemotaxis protein